MDGLSDPGGYLERLSIALESPARKPVVLVEKILANDEVLPSHWAVDGTTGYEFANLAGGLFVSDDQAQCLALLERSSPARTPPSIPNLCFII